MKIEILFKEEKVCSMKLDLDKKIIENISFTESKWVKYLPFSRNQSFEKIMSFLKSRVMPPRKGHEKLLESMGIEKYDVIEIIKKTEGQNNLDGFRVLIED